MSDKPVALVTGSRKGIGRFLAERLVRDGYVVVGCSRSPVDWELKDYHHLEADVSNEEQVTRLLNQISLMFDRLDLTINNAGVASMNHSLLMPGETVSRLFDVNVRGTFMVSRESAKLMRRRKFGRIVNITTVAVPLLIEGESVYAASKSAIETMTRIMARELAPFGITVNAVGPTPMETDLIRNVPKSRIESIVSRLAIKRLGEPRDVYNVVKFLAEPESDYVTGQVIYLGGV